MRYVVSNLIQLSSLGPATRDPDPPARGCVLQLYCSGQCFSLVLAVRESVRSMILLTRYAALENITALLYTGTHVRQYSTLHWTRQTYRYTFTDGLSV